MTWYRVDDKSSFHAKVVRAGNEAWGACTRAGAWSSDHGTDGFVPDEIANMIAKAKVWKRAEAAGGKDRFGLVERRDGGWQLHDFLDWNPSAAQIDEKREAVRKRVEQWRSKRVGNTDRNDAGNAACNALVTPPPSRPDPIPLRSDPSDLVPADAVPPAAQKAPEPDSPPPAPPVLTPPEPKVSKRKPKQQPLAVKVATGVGWKLWRSLYPQSKRNYGRYVDAPEDGPEMKRIVDSATDHAIGELRERGTPGDPVEPIVQAILEHWFKEYLRDDGGERGWIAEQRHPLRYVLKGITKYGTPWSRSRAGGSSGLPQEALQAREALHKSAEVRFGT